MRALRDTDGTAGVQPKLFACVGSCARVTLSWTVAGGIAAGGMLVSVLTLTGGVSPGFQLLAAPVLFLAGVALGFAHGCVLATVGRPRGLSRWRAVRRCAAGALLALPAVALGWVITMGLSLTAALVQEPRASLYVLSAGAWVFGLAVCAWAGLEGLRALARAVERWPESRAGSVLSGVTFIGVALLLLRYPPELLGSDLRLTGIGALALAAGVALWVALPLATLVLHHTSQRFLPESGGREAGM